MNQLNLPTKYANNIAAIITATSMYDALKPLSFTITYCCETALIISISSCTLKGTQTNPTSFNVQNRRKKKIDMYLSPANNVC